MSADDGELSSLCLACGLCCNGVLFKDVELQPGDDAPRFATLGLPLDRRGRKVRWPQPCAALDGCRCRIYADRPTRCRQFECALFKSVQAGRVEMPAALRVVRTAQQRAERVRRLLRALGDTDETVALSLRFKRVSKRFAAGAPDHETADRFGDLTLAVHDLNLLLREAFLPTPAA